MQRGSKEKHTVGLRRAGTDLGHPLFGEDNAGGLAVEAELVRHLHRRQDDLARAGALHGRSDEGHDDRGEGQSSVPDLASARDHASDLERRWPERLTGSNHIQAVVAQR